MLPAFHRRILGQREGLPCPRSVFSSNWTSPGCPASSSLSPTQSISMPGPCSAYTIQLITLQGASGAGLVGEMCSWQHGPRSTDVTSVCRAQTQGLWGGGGRHTFTHRRAYPLTTEEGGHPGKKLWLERRQHFRLAGGGAATVPIHWESPHTVCVLLLTIQPSEAGVLSTVDQDTLNI